MLYKGNTVTQTILNTVNVFKYIILWVVADGRHANNTDIMDNLNGHYGKNIFYTTYSFHVRANYFDASKELAHAMTANYFYLDVLGFPRAAHWGPWWTIVPPVLTTILLLLGRYKGLQVAHDHLLLGNQQTGQSTLLLVKSLSQTGSLCERA